MLQIKTIGTGSKGNCYLLESDNETLILDCGVSVAEIKKGLNFDLSKVVGACASHAHQDHLKSAKDLENMGITVWQPYLDEEKLQRRYFGGFMVRSFDLPHDGVPCCGFLIECPNGERMLYATDFEYIKYSFRKMRVRHMLIECNYQKDLVGRDASNYSHVLRGHSELGVTIDVVKDNKESIKTVVLCHLSSSNAEPLQMVESVKKIIPTAKVCVARRNETVELERECPF